MLKDKSQSIVFWLSITILVVLCVCFYVLVEKERAVRIITEQQLSRANAANNVLQFNLVKANKEIATRDEQIKLTLNKLEVAIKEKEALEGKVKEMTDKSSSVELPKIEVKAPLQ